MSRLDGYESRRVVGDEGRNKYNEIWEQRDITTAREQRMSEINIGPFPVEGMER